MNSSKKSKNLRVRFRQLRINKGTQRQVALDLRVTENTIRHIESGYGDPSVKLMFRLAKYFETNVYDLFPDLAEVDL